MSDSFEKLEEALASLKPQPASAQLRTTVGRRIGRRRLLLRCSAAALVAAAGLLGWLAWPHRAVDQNLPAPLADRVPGERDEHNRLVYQPPTLWSYRAAALRSADELDAAMRFGHRVDSPAIRDEPLTAMAYRKLDLSRFP